jgi:hypothetical protein
LMHLRTVHDDLRIAHVRDFELDPLAWSALVLTASDKVGREIADNAPKTGRAPPFNIDLLEN